MSLQNLQILALVTLVCVLAAIGVVITDQYAVNARFEPQLMFPGLDDRRGDVTGIHVTGQKREVRLKREGSGPWIIAGSDGYPADQAAAARLISAMEALVLADPRTERTEHFRKLKLEDPALGSGAVSIEFLDRDNGIIAGLVLGAMQAAPTADRPGQFYVRSTQGGRAWLAEGRVIATPDIRNWLDQTIGLPLETDIRSIAIDPVEGPSYKLERETAKAQFIFGNLPKKRRLRTDAAPLQLAQSLVFLIVDQVLPRPEKLPKAGSKASYGLFDDRQLHVTQWTDDAGNWLAIDLEGEWAEPLVGRAANFVFGISSTRAKALSPTLETFILPSE